MPFFADPNPNLRAAISQLLGMSPTPMGMGGAQPLPSGSAGGSTLADAGAGDGGSLGAGVDLSGMPAAPAAPSLNLGSIFQELLQPLSNPIAASSPQRSAGGTQAMGGYIPLGGTRVAAGLPALEPTAPPPTSVPAPTIRPQGSTIPSPVSQVTHLSTMPSPTTAYNPNRYGTTPANSLGTNANPFRLF